MYSFVSVFQFIIICFWYHFFLILTTVGYQPEPAFWWLWPIFGIAVSIFFVGVDRKKFSKLYYLGFFLFIGVCIFIAKNLNTQFAFAAVGCIYILTALFPENSKSFLRREVMPIVIPFAFGLLCAWSLHRNGLIVEQRNFIYVFLVVLYFYALSLITLAALCPNQCAYPSWHTSCIFLLWNHNTFLCLLSFFVFFKGLVGSLFFHKLF